MSLHLIYWQFQSLPTIQQKIEYLKSKQNDLESQFDINVTNLIKSWESKL